MDVVADMGFEPPFVIHVSGGLVLSKSPSPEVDKRLMQWYENAAISEDSRKDSTLAIGALSGKTDGERGDSLDKFIQKYRPEPNASEDEKLSWIEAIGNTGKAEYMDSLLETIDRSDAFHEAASGSRFFLKVPKGVGAKLTKHLLSSSLSASVRLTLRSP